MAAIAAPLRAAALAAERLATRARSGLAAMAARQTPAGCEATLHGHAGKLPKARWHAACVTRIRRKNVSAWTFGSFGDCCLVWPKPKDKGLSPAGAGEAEVKAGVRRWFVLQQRC